MKAKERKKRNAVLRTIEREPLREMKDDKSGKMCNVCR